MKELIKPPIWAVKKAKRSITLYHFYKIDEGTPEPYALADWVIIVSFKKGLNISLGKYGELFMVKTLKSKKWVAYMGLEFKPSKSQSIKDLLKFNPAIKWHIIDTIFVPGPTIKRR